MQRPGRALALARRVSGAMLWWLASLSLAAAGESVTASSVRESIAPKILLEKLAGSWEGRSQTWLEPDKLANDSAVKGTFLPVMEGRFLRHEYQGSMQGKPHRGEELIAWNAIAGRFQLSWVDDFHMNYGIMFSEGEATAHGFSVKGNYEVGGGSPAWGWRTVYELLDDDTLLITAYNVLPDGREARAVETRYRRVKP